MAVPIEFYVYVGYGLFAMIAVIGIMNFLLGGFLGPFMKVKRSRGKKVIVRVRNQVQDYFRAGVIEEGFLVFADREKNNRRIPMQPGVVSRAITVYWVEVDDEKNCFYKRATGEAVSTYDAVRVDNLLVRALTRPGLFGDQTVKILLILIIVLLVAVIAIGFMTYKNYAGIKELILAAQTAGTGVVA